MSALSTTTTNAKAHNFVCEIILPQLPRQTTAHEYTELVGQLLSEVLGQAHQ